MRSVLRGYDTGANVVQAGPLSPGNGRLRCEGIGQQYQKWRRPNSLYTGGEWSQPYWVARTTWDASDAPLRGDSLDPGPIPIFLSPAAKLLLQCRETTAMTN